MNMRRAAFVMVIAIGMSATFGFERAAAGRQQTSAPEQPRTNHAAGAYDAQRGRVVLIGGLGDPSGDDRDRVWTWNGTRWETAEMAGPPGRVNAGAAYDASRQRVIVSGGARKSASGSWEAVSDTWESDPKGWRRLADRSDFLPRDHHALVEDGHGVLMFGGISSDRSGPWLTDTWQLRDETWHRVATEGPIARARTALAFDSKRGQVVLFGGVSAPPPGQKGPQTFLNDTWIWNGDRWTLAATGGPARRYAHGMAFDERAGVVLLYGGAAAHSGAPLHDMWQWDGSTWTEIPLSGATPGDRYQPVMVYDKARDRTVLYGGIANASDTWEWDGQRWRLAGSRSRR
jgi:hypothetical protein